MSNSIPPFMATDPNVYEHFMGRWSTRLAEPFLEFAGIHSGDRVLDVGCGTGAITLAVAKRGATVIGMDASEPYLGAARSGRSHPNARYEHGDARRMHYPDASFDACVSTLAIDVIPEVDEVAAEMRRVTRPGGVVACGTFDFWGGVSAQALVMDTGSVLDEGVRAVRNFMKSRPIVQPNGQARLWQAIGLVEVVEAPIVLSFDYASFEDYWSSFSVVLSFEIGWNPRLQNLKPIEPTWPILTCGIRFHSPFGQFSSWILGRYRSALLANSCAIVVS